VLSSSMQRPLLCVKQLVVKRFYHDRGLCVESLHEFFRLVDYNNFKESIYVLMSNTITLSKTAQAELTQRVTSQAGRADEARRARVILLLDAGHTWAAIRAKLECTDSFMDRWSKRFADKRLAGLFSRHAGQLPTTLTAALEARILEWTVKRKPRDGSTQWSTRKLGEQLGVSHMMVARVWCRHALVPQRLERCMAPSDPNFETKAAEIIVCTCIRRSMLRCSVSMRRRRFRRSIAKIPCCPSSGDALSGMASSTAGAAKSST